jgi:NAD(P)-dependent dehydrogenase (short-subunit alcohol dehydrogenase family)
MGELDGRVAVVTGAGRGIGREHALLMAREGASVVVNDVGAAADGSGSDAGPADDVVTEIREAGGQAIVDTSDISSWDGAANLIGKAIDAFGRLDVLVNNAGILRDRYLASMTEAEWDAVIQVHLKGHFAPLRHAVEYWKTRVKAGETVRASVINTTSPVGTTVPNPGQTNYAAAKAGIAALSQVAAVELARYGVRVNAIAPGARTRMSQTTPELTAMVAAPKDPNAFDVWDAANVSPFVAYLATADCPLTGQVFYVLGGKVQVLSGWSVGQTIIDVDERLSVGLLRATVDRVLVA